MSLGYTPSHGGIMDKGKIDRLVDFAAEEVVGWTNSLNEAQELVEEFGRTPQLQGLVRYSAIRVVRCLALLREAEKIRDEYLATQN